MATYITPTSSPQTIKYLSPQDQSKVFTFYTDLNYFLVRPFNNINDFAANYPSPVQVPLPNSGVQSACFNADESVIFILDSTGLLLIYHIGFETINPLSNTTFTLITDSYYEEPINCIIFIKEIPSGTYMRKYDLSMLFHIGNYFTIDIHFYVDPTATVSTRREVVSSLESVAVFNIPNPAPCPSGTFYNGMTTQCDPCPTNCTSCLSNLICFNCESGYAIADDNMCAFVVVNKTEENDASTVDSLNMAQLISDLVGNRVMKAVNTIPGGRKMLPFLCFLVNIDELWLYQYH